MADEKKIPEEDWIPEIPFDSAEWADVGKDFKPMSAEARSAAAKVKIPDDGPPKIPVRK